jgi:hypothetical protein
MLEAFGDNTEIMYGTQAYLLDTVPLQDQRYVAVGRRGGDGSLVKFYLTVEHAGILADRLSALVREARANK